jgi:UDP-GlcNAc:undecaprenyl-phosphate/decaprenyl-phosphate GlcNAc-1-phosphate transferase
MTAKSLMMGALATLAVGLVLQPLVLRMLTAARVLDHPKPRSFHTVPIPRGGGVAVASAAAAGLLIHPQARLLLVPLLLYAAIGLGEDVRGISVPARLLLHAGAGAVTGVLLIPSTPVGFTAGVLLGLVTFWLTAYANAFNFMDGVNGISAVQATLAGAVYTTLGWWQGIPVLAVGGTVTAAAAITFLPWNAGRARMFLGDAGSYALGGLLGALAAYGVLHGAPAEAVLAPLALYLADTGWTLARRCWRGEPWYRSHCSHAYQRLVTRLGWSHQRVTATTALVTGTVCALGLASVGSGPLVRLALAGVAAALLAAYLAAPTMLAAKPYRTPTRTEEVTHV